MPEIQASASDDVGVTRVELYLDTSALVKLYVVRIFSASCLAILTGRATAARAPGP